jgi:hypothetical protein
MVQWKVVEFQRSRVEDGRKEGNLRIGVLVLPNSKQVQLDRSRLSRTIKIANLFDLQFLKKRSRGFFGELTMSCVIPLFLSNA